MRAAVSLLLALLPGVALAQTQDRDPRELVVTAKGRETRRGDVLTAISVVTRDEVLRAGRPTLGEALDGLPGVSQTFFGAGASRPVIRGLAGERVRTIVGGLSTGDVAATSPDHAIGADPLATTRVEVIRGPGTLLWGNSAVGGVIAVEDGRVPDRRPEGGFAGEVAAQGGTVDDARALSARLDVAAGEEIVLHLDGFDRDTDDYEIPGAAESARLRAEDGEGPEAGGDGRPPNSDVDSQGFGVGAAWLFAPGSRVGLAVGRFETNYGVPGHAHEEEKGGEEEEGEGEEEGEEEVRIDLEQTRVDLRADVAVGGGFASDVRLRAAYIDYEHVELENGDPGTVFENEQLEARAELVQRETSLLGGTLTGVLGLQAETRDFSALGAEAFVPPSETTRLAAFALQTLEFGAWRVEGGLRLEHQESEADAIGDRPAQDPSDTTLSLSAGAAWRPAPELLLGLTLTRTERAPAPEERFSFGPHLATRSFEIGDPGLDPEEGLSAEATLRYEGARAGAALSLFATSYDGFIIEFPTGAEEDGLPVFVFQAVDATFWGAELEASVVLADWAGWSFGADATAEYVRGRADDLPNEDLPRIPPASVTLGLTADTPEFAARAELAATAEQDDVAAFERPSDGFTFVNAALSWAPAAAPGLDIAVTGRNLFDEEGRVHASFLKDLAPLPGRDLRLTARWRF